MGKLLDNQNIAQEKILNIADSKNKKLIELCDKIKDEVEHLPDSDAIGRISNYTNQISVLQVELEMLKKILT